MRFRGSVHRVAPRPAMVSVLPVKPTTGSSG